MGPSFMGPDAELKSFFLRRFFELYSQEHPSWLGLLRNQEDPRNTCPLERTEFSWVGGGRNAPFFMGADGRTLRTSAPFLSVLLLPAPAIQEEGGAVES